MKDFDRFIFLCIMRYRLYTVPAYTIEFAYW